MLFQALILTEPDVFSQQVHRLLRIRSRDRDQDVIVITVDLGKQRDVVPVTVVINLFLD